MKIFIQAMLAMAFAGLSSNALAQTEMVLPPSNRSVSSLEKNLLFFANTKYKVTQRGSAPVDLQALFDGSFFPTYSGTGINPSNPQVILIENFPLHIVQAGAWVGWTARYWFPKRFKIEFYDVFSARNEWVTLADVNNYVGGNFIVRFPRGDSMPSKIRYTFYQTEDNLENRLGLSELFYIQPEGAKAYDGLMVQYDHQGYVGIGTAVPKEMLSVNGKMRAHELKVETTGWPDYVFKPDYDLLSLEDLEAFVQTNGHLPEVPKAEDAEADGVWVGEMNKVLLKKIEELTLHLIKQEKKIKYLDSALSEIQKLYQYEKQN